MYAYKGFEPDLSCRGYRFVMGKNVTPEANCASNGFHCAENPLDCLSYYTRDGINAKIESLGAHAGSSVSSKTDYLICGENAGSKLAKARELGIKILSPDEFFRMAGESA